MKMFKNVIKNIKDGCYEVFRKVFPPKKSNKAVNKKVQDGVFLVVILCFPVLQFIVFYIGVNFRSILLAFQKYDVTQINNFWGGFVFDGEFTDKKRFQRIVYGVGIRSYLFKKLGNTVPRRFIHRHTVKRFCCLLHLEKNDICRIFQSGDFFTDDSSVDSVRCGGATDILGRFARTYLVERRT